MGRCCGERLFDWLWLLAWGAASSAWCVTAARELGATFDEPVYVARGLEGWQTFSHRGLIRLGTMPLAIDLDTLPLFLWEQVRGAPFDPNTDLDQLLPWARAGTLVFWWVLLYYSRRAGRTLAGPWGGRLAVALIALEPNLLAHASLATTDIAVTACLLALMVHYQAGRECSWRYRIGVPALWYGAAVLAKASALAYGPLCMLAIELERDGGALPRACLRALTSWPRSRETAKHLDRVRMYLLPPPWRGRVGVGGDELSETTPPHPNPPPPGGREQERPPPPGGREFTSNSGRVLDAANSSLWAALQRLRRDWTAIIAGGLTVAVIYCGSDWQPEPSFVRWAHELPNSGSARAMIWVSEHLCIFSNGLEGIVRQVRHNIKGHDGTYLLGHVWPRSAVWYYFPVALTMKLSPLLLVLPLVLILVRPRVLVNWALVGAIILLAFSLDCRVQIGIRLVLPLVALLVVGLAGAAVRASEGSARIPTFVRTVLIGGMAWMVVATVTVWPNALCYTNELWGGTANGYRCLSDSNYDWGQGLRELTRWERRRGLDTLDVWYFGTDPALARLPLHEVKLHVEPVEDEAQLRARVRGHYLAVSTTLLHGMVCDTPEHRHAAALLLGRRPVDRTTTFLIYDFTEADAHRY